MMYNHHAAHAIFVTDRSVALAGLLLLLAGVLTGCGDSQTRYSAANPRNAESSVIQNVTVRPNSNPKAPLAVILEFAASAPANVTVEVESTEHAWSRSFRHDKIGPAQLPLVGFLPATEYRIRVLIKSRPGADAFDERFEITTPPLPGGPSEFPPITINKATPDRMEPGYTLLGIRRRALGRPQFLSTAQRKFGTDWGMIVALDALGRVVWYYDAGTRIAGIDQLSNGNILFHETQFRTREIDMLGNVVNEWYAERRPQGPSDTAGAIPIKGIQTLHHQPLELPNGNFLAFTANARSVPNYYTSDTDPNAPRKTQMVMGDDVIEFDRKGEVVWRWSAWDHLDPYRIGYDTIWAYWWVRGFDQHMDWTHANGLSYDPSDDSVIVSLRHQDAILKIDKKSGDIRWILGDHSGWSESLRTKLLTPIGDLVWPYHQHNPRVTDKGTLIVFDNHAFGARPFDTPTPPYEAFSRGVEYKIDEKNMTVTQIWASASARDEDSCFTYAMSDAHRMPVTGNRLVIHAFCVPYRKDITYDNFDVSKRHPDDFSYGGRIREHFGDDPTDVVFDVEIRDPYEIMQWEVYGGLRTPELHRYE